MSSDGKDAQSTRADDSRSAAEKNGSPAPRERSPSPRSAGHTPRKRSPSPRKRSPSPRKRSLSPRRKSSRSPSPRNRDRSRSRSRSPVRRRSPPIRRRSRSRSRSPSRGSGYRGGRGGYRRDDFRDRRGGGRGGYRGGRDDRGAGRGARSGPPPDDVTKSEKQRERERRRYEREEAGRSKTSSERAADEIESDSRTVFCFNLPIRATEDDVADHFEQYAGPVEDVRLITDRHSRKSKGCGYVEFKTRDSINKALALSGRQLLGQTIMVQMTQSEKNRIAAAQAALAAGPSKIYIGGLHPAVTEDDVRSLVQPIGQVESVELQRDDAGNSKGFCFIAFKKPEEASRAQKELNGLELAGSELKVGLVSTPSASIPLPTSFARSGGVGGGGGGGMLDEDDGGMGLHMDAGRRAMLMAQLQRDDKISPLEQAQHAQRAATLAMQGITLAPLTPAGAGNMSIPNPYAPVPMSHVSPPPPPLRAALPAIKEGPPSVCVLLTNLFEPPGPLRGFDFNVDEIREDVADEVQQYGGVSHIFVDSASAGNVYLKMNSIDAARRVVSALNHRWFAKKQISATFIDEESYYMKFPSALAL